jgi:hypothetical protein
MFILLFVLFLVLLLSVILNIYAFYQLSKKSKIIIFLRKRLFNSWQQYSILLVDKFKCEADVITAYNTIKSLKEINYAK